MYLLRWRALSVFLTEVVPFISMQRLVRFWEWRRFDETHCCVSSVQVRSVVYLLFPWHSSGLVCFSVIAVMAAEMEEKFKDICHQKNVMGALVMTSAGAPIRSSMDGPTTALYANMVYRLMTTCKDLIRESDASNDAKFFRLTTKKYELMVSPDTLYTFVIVHALPEDQK